MLSCKLVGGRMPSYTPDDPCRMLPGAVAEPDEPPLSEAGCILLELLILPERTW